MPRSLKHGGKLKRSAAVDDARSAPALKKAKKTSEEPIPPCPSEEPLPRGVPLTSEESLPPCHDASHALRLTSEESLPVKKNATSVEATELPTTANAPTKPTTSMKSKKKKKSAEVEPTESPADPAEQARKNLQRETQKMVAEMRAKGYSEDQIFRAKRKLKSDHWWSAEEKRDYWKTVKDGNRETKDRVCGRIGGSGASGGTSASGFPGTATAAGTIVSSENQSAGVEDGAPAFSHHPDLVDQNRADEDADYEDDDAANHQRHHEVIVIPIVWRGRSDRGTIIETAKDVKQVLVNMKIDCWIDARRQHTPGQKFAFWEHKDVKFRVEVGPKDLERGEVCVCRHPEIAGDYRNTKKKYVPIPPGGAKELLLALKNFGEGTSVGEKLAGIREEGGDGEDDHDGDGGDAEEAGQNIASSVRDYSKEYGANEIGGTVADYTNRFGKPNDGLGGISRNIKVPVAGATTVGGSSEGGKKQAKKIKEAVGTEGRFFFTVVGIIRIACEDQSEGLVLHAETPSN